MDTEFKLVIPGITLPIADELSMSQAAVSQLLIRARLNDCLEDTTVGVLRHQIGVQRGAKTNNKCFSPGHLWLVGLYCSQAMKFRFICFKKMKQDSSTMLVTHSTAAATSPPRSC